MNARLTIIASICVAFVSVGCSAPVRIAPGLSALRVKIIAEPKTGYRMPSRASVGGAYDSDYDSSASTGDGTQFERVNYRALEDVVVWIEPESHVQLSPLPSSINVPVAPHSGRSTSPSVFACGTGATVIFSNRSRSAESVYSLSDPNDFDLGTIAPTEQAVFSPRAPGLIEVLTDSSDDPVAIVYVAPTNHVQRVTSGKAAVFNNLPPGRYRVSCWHPRLPGASADVILVADILTETTLTVSVNLLPHAP